MKHLQIVPRDGQRLYGAMISKEAEIRRNGRGTFSRVGRKQRNKTRWKHAKYAGRVELESASSDLISVEIKSPDKGDESRLLSAFLGWLDRHFGDRVGSVNIQYQ
ncbi:MAG: hypothetical protein GEU91_10575 [Rhizobiales bacterium]|nr:hypothetical protein [Hyphomicrobiales bacterium]